MIDISTEINPIKSQKRQFAPEYSYKSYIAMLEKEYSIGDYLSTHSDVLKITSFAR